METRGLDLISADYMIVLAKEGIGAELLFNEAIVQRIVRLMKVETQAKICLSFWSMSGDMLKAETTSLLL